MCCVSRLQVNVLSNLLLVIRLSPLLVKTAKAHGTVSRIVTVSSGLFHTSTLDSAILGGKANVYKVMSDQEYYKSSPEYAFESRVQTSEYSLIILVLPR